MRKVWLGLVLLSKPPPNDGAFSHGLKSVMSLTHKGTSYVRLVERKPRTWNFPRIWKVVENEDLNDDEVIFRHTTEIYMKLYGYNKVPLNFLELPVVHFEHNGIRGVAILLIWH